MENFRTQNGLWKTKSKGMLIGAQWCIVQELMTSNGAVYKPMGTDFSGKSIIFYTMDCFEKNHFCHVIFWDKETTLKQLLNLRKQDVGRNQLEGKGRILKMYNPLTEQLLTVE